MVEILVTSFVFFKGSRAIFQSSLCWITINFYSLEIQRPVMSNLCYQILGICLLIVCQVPLSLFLQLGRTRKALHLSYSGYLIKSAINAKTEFYCQIDKYRRSGRCPTLLGLLFPTIGLTVRAFWQMTIMMSCYMAKMLGYANRFFTF